MFSLQKIMVLIGILSAVWAAFRFIGQLQKAQQERAKVAQREAKKQKQAQKQSDAGEDAGTAKAVELSACPKCGDYVPGGKHIC